MYPLVHLTGAFRNIITSGVRHDVSYLNLRVYFLISLKTDFISLKILRNNSDCLDLKCIGDDFCGKLGQYADIFMPIYLIYLYIFCFSYNIYMYIYT